MKSPRDDAVWQFTGTRSHYVTHPLALMRKMMIPVSSTIISTTDVRRMARHTGRPVSLNRAPPTPPASPRRPPRGGLGSPTSRERFTDLRDVSDLWPHRWRPSEDLNEKQHPVKGSWGFIMLSSFSFNIHFFLIRNLLNHRRKKKKTWNYQQVWERRDSISLLQ